ncbi:MAG TPA: hypothetical protein VHR65_01250 [Solirubrobacterales bacterium]|jgi:hypothetical protein|nr:hypothetical protein [Solirubrobacterales bacterium]
MAQALTNALTAPAGELARRGISAEMYVVGGARTYGDRLDPAARFSRAVVNRSRFP